MTPYELSYALEEFSGIIPPAVCWLDDDDADPSINYCLGCAEKKLDELRAAGEVGDEATVSSSCGPWEADGCCHCEICGRALNYRLTQYGVFEELEHFKTWVPRPTKEEAFHIGRMVEAVEYTDDDALKAEVIEIAERVLALCRASEETQ